MAGWSTDVFPGGGRGRFFELATHMRLQPAVASIGKILHNVCEKKMDFAEESHIFNITVMKTSIAHGS